MALVCTDCQLGRQAVDGRWHLMPRHHYPRCTRCGARLASSDWRPRECATCQRQDEKRRTTP